MARSPVGRALVFATSLSVGAAAFLLLIGFIIALGGEALLAGITFESLAGRIIRTIVGVGLIFLGLIQLGVIPVSLARLEHLALPVLRLQARERRRRPIVGYTVLGFGYIFAGLSWTGPILAGLAGFAFAIGGFGAALIAFVSAALVMVLLLFGLALAIATLQEEVVATMRARAVQVKRWGGWILIVIGAWLIILAIFANFFARVFPV